MSRKFTLREIVNYARRENAKHYHPSVSEWDYRDDLKARPFRDHRIEILSQMEFGEGYACKFFFKRLFRGLIDGIANELDTREALKAAYQRSTPDLTHRRDIV